MFSLKPCTLPIRVLPVLPILYYHRKDGDLSAPSELQSSIPPFLYASTSACLQLASIPLYLLVAPSTACLQSSRAPYLHASLSLYRRRVFRAPGLHISIPLCLPRVTHRHYLQYARCRRRVELTTGRVAAAACSGCSKVWRR